jgi:hypothetical protein
MKISFLLLLDTTPDYSNIAPSSTSMDERVKQVVAEEAQQIKAISKDAIQSRAYIYPIKVGFSITHSGFATWN